MRREETRTVDLDVLIDSVAADLPDIGDARTVPGSGLQLDPHRTGRLAPSMHRVIVGGALLTDDFWNVRHICANRINGAGTSATRPAAGRCATADSASRASVAVACRSPSD